MENILKGLNAEQKAAVLHDHEKDFQLLILAGAGSGKTSVLTKRIQCRILQGVSPASILGLTFTVLAAEEMKERVEKVFPGANVKLCTFHSLALSILKEKYGDKFGYELLGFEKFPVPKEVSENDFLCDLANAKIKAKNISRELLFSKTFTKSTEEKLKPSKERVFRTGHVVFEDLIYLAIELLETNAEVLGKIQETYQEILVDEYQDINPSGYKLVHLILGNRNSLFAVGDDDQAIYGFRGADIRNILRFQKDFPKSTLIRLEWNYRSVPSILHTANCIFKNKPLLFRKVLRAGNNRQDALFLENRKPEVWWSKDPVFEVGRIAAKIKEMRFIYDLPYEAFAVLVRYNRQREYYETALPEYSVPIKTETTEGIHVETVHSSKGLQYTVVFYAGLSEGLTPGACSGTKKERKIQLEEERRLFYVGVTRAEAFLVLLYCRNRFWKGHKVNHKPSRFLKCVEPQIKDSALPLLFFKLFFALKALSYMAFAIFQLTFRMLFRKEISAWLEVRVQEFASFCMRACRIDLNIENQATLSKIDWNRPVVVISNHQSYMDIPIIFLTIERKIGFLAKYELKRIPFLNFWMKHLGCVFVKREKRGGGLKAHQELLRIKTPKIVVFPEGSRSKDGKLHNFKSGGFRLAKEWNATILPIRIKGSRNSWESRKDSKKVSVRVQILEPLDLSLFESEGVKDFVMPEIRNRMENV